MLRHLRKWTTARATSLGTGLARNLPPGFSRAVGGAVRIAGPLIPRIPRIVRKNMRAAGVDHDGAVKAYFSQVGAHLSSALRILKYQDDPARVAAIAQDEIDVDPSVQQLRDALAPGRGVLVAPAHVCNYLLTLVRLNLEVPLVVYLRWSSDRRKQAIKESWCRASGIRVILEPENGADPTSRAAACVEALNAGAALVMTPDIAQKDHKGVPVHLLGRTALLPTGPASIAMLAGAPILPVFGRLDAARHRIQAHEPIIVPQLSRKDGGRPLALQTAMQSWAVHFEAFLRACPEAWFLWADNRWTRVFRGDPRYSPPIDEVTPTSASAEPEDDDE